jgi:hypothetical protein
MDGFGFPLFVLAAFAGGFVSGFSGFAMGLVVSGVWLHIITPLQTATLIAGYGLLTQGYGILKLRQALNWQNIWPLSLGTTIGIPIGVILLTYINPVWLRFGVGVLLVFYTIYGLARPAFKPMKIGIGPDIAMDLQRARRWIDRTWRRHLDHLLPVARLDQGSATRGISTRAVRGLCGHFHFDGHHWRRHVGNPQIIWAWPAVFACGPVERLQALWKN